MCLKDHKKVSVYCNSCSMYVFHSLNEGNGETYVLGKGGFLTFSATDEISWYLSNLQFEGTSEQIIFVR